MKSAIEFPALLNKDEVAKTLKVHPRTVDNMIGDGRIPHVKLGRSVRFRPEDIRKFIEAHVIAAA